MSFGPKPWQQAHWDGRAAANFIGGGAGAGLIFSAGLVSPAGAEWRAGLFIGMVLVGIGLGCVWLEIGRPLRALNVFLNPRRSWMSREALVAMTLFPAGVAALVQVPGTSVLAAALALGFLFCQGNMLRAAKGIPAWRERLTLPLMVSTGLAEGAGLFCVIAAGFNHGGKLLWWLFAAVLALRWLLVSLWWRRLAGVLNPIALVATHRSAATLRIGSLVALSVVLVLAVGPAGPWSLPLQALAGLVAAFSGAAFKWLLVTHAAFNQGFALAHLPVRGVRRA